MASLGAILSPEFKSFLKQRAAFVAPWLPGLRSGEQALLRYRAQVAKRYLKGNGIEIGALHEPLPVPASAKVGYVDRLSVPELRNQYPELRDLNLVEVDFVDTGEKLEKFEASSQDFVIANHFLEHCEDPIGAIKSMYRVLKPEGILYLSIPDMRFTFDKNRPVTSLDHLVRDHQSGPSGSRRGHFEEYVRHCDGISEGPNHAARVQKLLDQDYSIHFHVWTQAEILELLLYMKKELQFEIELATKNEHEFINILRKTQ